MQLCVQARVEGLRPAGPSLYQSIWGIEDLGVIVRWVVTAEETSSSMEWREAGVWCREK